MRFGRRDPKRCDCLGYWFPHRKGGGACFYGARADYYHALRQGLTRTEAMALLSANQIEQMFPLGAKKVILKDLIAQRIINSPAELLQHLATNPRVYDSDSKYSAALRRWIIFLKDSRHITIDHQPTYRQCILTEKGRLAVEKKNDIESAESVPGKNRAHGLD